MKKITTTILGIFVFLVLIFILNHLDKLIVSWVSGNFSGYIGSIYYRLAVFLIIPIATLFLNINNLINIKNINIKNLDYKLLLVYILAGFLVIFIPLMPVSMPIEIRIFLSKNSFLGGIIMGVGLIICLSYKK